MATVELKEIATDITWGDATRDINENNRKIQVALATVSAAGEGNAAWGKSTAESAELIIGGSGTKVVSLEGHTHETSEVNGLDAKLSQTDASIDSLKSSDTAIKGQISGVNASIGDLYNKVQDIDEGGVKKTELKTLTVNVNGTKVGEYDTKADKTINITADMLGLSGAMTFVGVTVTAISQGSTQNEIDLDDSTTYIAKKGDVVIYGNKEFVWVGSKWQELGDEQSFALKSVTVTGTGYLTGGGNLEANRTIDIASSVKTKIDNGDAALTKANAIETNLANNYPTKNGTGASGTWGVDISGKAASADKVANALTFNSSGAGAAIGSTYDGSGAKTISYNTVGAAKAVHSHAFSDITGKPTTLAGYGITDGASNAELSAHASNTDIHLAEGDRANIEAALVMASDVSSELAVILEGYDTTPTLSTELGKKANVSDLTAHTGNTNVHITASERSSWNAKYSKPATGIPVDDMEAGVAESLANADLALADVGALSQNFINHEGDTTVHITASERKAWNGKVDESSLTAHTGNTTIHITASERSSWNSKYSKPATGIPVDDMEAGVAESLANADLALADVGALSQNFINHEGDTTVHITANERKAWNAKANASTLNSHTGNTTIHTTAEEKASWNGKYTKPTTGIPAEDLSDDVNASINSGSMSYELASEANGKVSLLLESYGAEIPDLKNELAKKQDKLVSGTSIKTVNGTSLLGSGNITTPKTTVVDNLTSTSGTDALSANQGKVLNDKFGGYIPITGGVAGNVELFSNNRGETLIGNPDNNAYVRIREDMVGVGDNWFINTNGVAGFKNLTANGASVITVTDVVDSLTSTGNDKPLSANQGRVLNEKKYEKPSNGIPMSDLNSAVQQSIECGDEAYASIRSGTIRAREALIQWGGSNNNEGNLSPIESLLTDSANRLTFGNAGGVTVEYSTNGGSTWNAYTERTDYEKLLYPVADAVFCLGGSSSTDRATTLNDMLRITINAKGVGRYLGGIRKMLIYGGTRNARSLNVVLEARRATGGVEGGGNNAFEQVGTLTYDGWPAWGAISLNDSFFGTWSTATTYNNRSVIEYRLTFSVNSVSNTTYGAPYIQLIKLHSLTVYEANEFIAKYGNPLLLMNDGYIHADRELYLTKRVQAQNMQVSNLNVLSSLNITPSTTIQGVLTVGSKISAGGNIEGSAKLMVEGDATLKSNATVSGDLSVGGTLNYTRTRLETSEASVMLDASKYTVINCGGELTINLPNGYATDGKEYLCEMRTGSIGPTVSFPADIKFAFGENFVLGFQPDSVYQISIQNSLAVVIPFV